MIRCSHAPCLTVGLARLTRWVPANEWALARPGFPVVGESEDCARGPGAKRSGSTSCGLLKEVPSPSNESEGCGGVVSDFDDALGGLRPASASTSDAWFNRQA